MSFNRNIVECKFSFDCAGFKLSRRFNRNIVECKSGPGKRPDAGSHCFNRNIVECKLYMVKGKCLMTCVLIETLWNVNLIIDSLGHPGRTVLIETLWNVNSKITLLSIISSLSFNRNIVECKFDVQLNNRNCLYVLIETLWNVNSNLLYRIISFASVLIETLWNVNETVQQLPGYGWSGFNRNIVECKLF